MKLHKRKILDIIKSVKTLEQLNVVMEDIKIPRTKENVYSDSSFMIEKSEKGQYSQVRLETHLNGLWLAGFKVYFILKMYGYLEKVPTNAKMHAEIYRKTLKDLSKIYGDLFSFLELNPEDIETYIENKKDLHAKSLYLYLRDLRLYATFAQKSLPSFLQISSSVFGGPLYEDLEERYYIELDNQKKPGTSTRPIYPLSDLTVLIREALDLIEHGDSILDFFEMLTSHDIFNTTESSQIRSLKAWKIIRESDLQVSDPVLMQMIEKVKIAKSYNKHNEKGKSIGVVYGTLLRDTINRITLLESASVLVVLLLSAMRRSELSRLSRVLKIEADDDFLLRKFIFKTAFSRAGEEHIVPLPQIGVKSLEILSRLAIIRDGNTEGRIISLSQPALSSKMGSDSEFGNRINFILGRLPKFLGMEGPTPHQLRHVMAYLVLNVTGKEGLEMVRYLLGHSSILMTLTYLSRINPFFRNSLEELAKEQSKKNLDQLYIDMQKGKKVYGVKSAQFNGVVNEEMIDLLYEYWGDKIDQGLMMILTTPIAMCVHDLSKPGEMNCQRGLDMEDLQGILPAPSRCDPKKCPSAVYREDHIENLMDHYKKSADDLREDEVFRRLSENTYFNPDDFVVEIEDEYRSIIEVYTEDKKR